MLVAVYIDPVNRILLNEGQIAITKEALCDVAVRINGLLPEKSHLLQLMKSQILKKKKICR